MKDLSIDEVVIVDEKGIDVSTKSSPKTSKGYVAKDMGGSVLVYAAGELLATSICDTKTPEGRAKFADLEFMCESANMAMLKLSKARN